MVQSLVACREGNQFVIFNDETKLVQLKRVSLQCLVREVNGVGEVSILPIVLSRRPKWW